MILTRLLASGSPSERPEPLDLDADGSRERLLDWYLPGSADWVRLNMISTVSGSAAGPDGTSESITSRTDRRILGVIRQLADAVLVGAGTVRAEAYLMPKRAALAIVTSTGNLEGHRLPEDTAGNRLFVLCPPAAADRARATLGIPGAAFLEIPERGDGIDAVSIVTALRSAGLRSVVCEGGPELAGRLIAGGVLDELCLSQAPFLGGAPLRAFGPDAFDGDGDGDELRRLELTQLLIDEDSGTYARWRVQRPDPAGR